MKLSLLREDEFDFLDTNEPVEHGEDAFGPRCEICSAKLCAGQIAFGQSPEERAVRTINSFEGMWLEKLVNQYDGICCSCICQKAKEAKIFPFREEKPRDDGPRWPKYLKEDEFDFLDTDEPVEHGDDHFSSGNGPCGMCGAEITDDEMRLTDGDVIDALQDLLAQNPGYQLICLNCIEGYMARVAYAQSKMSKLAATPRELNEDEFDFLDTDEPVEHGDDNFNFDRRLENIESVATYLTRNHTSFIWPDKTYSPHPLPYITDRRGKIHDILQSLLVTRDFRKVSYHDTLGWHLWFGVGYPDGHEPIYYAVVPNPIMLGDGPYPKGEEVEWAPLTFDRHLKDVGHVLDGFNVFPG